MNPEIKIRQMAETDVAKVYQELSEHDIRKPLEYVQTCWEGNKTGERITLIAEYDGRFAGWLHLLTKSYYPFFAEQGIPEINNFDVVPPLRRLGIGNALMDTVEQIAFDRYGIVGIGVGLYSSYGNAQRIYAKRGYIPDGREIMYHGEPPELGSYVEVGHDLALYMTKSPITQNKME
ncbi:GNAT family N-acetyltransferase [Paenibacillus nasutitermitis]|uniref:N-acetyltransferase n=1 Tax=Paenibacillus nasutitermitis TaxID=1652958 RepID=A0A916YQU4_9BACL|nr:GNAT family N-acetyltransferase [Paenibacillus nasutitermitis]GGD56880.1 N-acetyltransferase [Paenibacillus nasutitermitis]